MRYTILLKCESKSDAEKYDRKLEMNSYEAAMATFQTLVKRALEDLIDPYVIEFYYGEQLGYKLENIKI